MKDNGRKYILLTVILLIFGVLPIQAKRITGGYQSLPIYMDGSMQIYDFSAVDNQRIWADSLQPIYVNYLARHGARCLTSEKKVGKLIKAIQDASDSGNLTPHGKAYHQYLNSLISTCTGKWGLLSEVGNSEAPKLGEEMHKLLPDLFSEGEVYAKSTFVPRSIMTMFQSLHALEIQDQTLEMHTSSGEQNSQILYFFGVDTVYATYRRKGEWIPVYKDFEARHVPIRPAQALFRKGFIKDRKQLQELTMEIYYSMQAQRALGHPSPTTKWLSLDEYRECWRTTNLEHYLKNCISPISTVCASATAPLIRKIIYDSDSAIKNGKTKMNGYFGHAETLLPFLSVIGLPGCFVDRPDYENLETQWQVNKITPLAANFCIIFLKGKSGKIYVATRLNGSYVSPIPSSPYIILWDDLKDHWLHRVEALENSLPIPPH